MPDEQGRPRDAHELNRQLADTIGASVEQLLGMSGFSEANNMAIEAALAARGTTAGQPGSGGVAPEQPAAGGPPASGGGAPPTPTPTPTPSTAPEGEIDWESTKAANGLYLGKYKTKAEAVRGVANTVGMAKVAFSRAEATEAENARLRSEMETLRNRPAATQAVVPQDSTTSAPTRGKAVVPSPKLDTVLSKLQETGNLDAEDLNNLVGAISEHAATVARQAASEEHERRKEEAQKVADRWGRVEAYMAEKHPDSVNFTDELALHIKTYPLIAAGVNALIAQDRHEEATEQAWNDFVSKNGTALKFTPAPATKENIEKELSLEAADQVRREAVDKARRDAGIVGAGSGGRGVHENANAGPSPDEYDEAVARMRQGDGAKWRALVFGDALNHPIFG